MKKITALLLCCALVAALAGCGKGAASDAHTPIPGLDTGRDVTLKIAIPYETNKALNNVSNAFMTLYPNVSIQLQYIEDYDTNAVQLFRANAVDIILQKDVFYAEYEGGGDTDDYYYNFAADGEIDFSDTTPDITDNYRHTRTDSDGSETVYLYSYPLGGETRGVFVNKTLLESFGLDVPENYDELLACCETLKANGLIPIQGGGDTAAYGLGMAPAANAVVHDEAALAAMRGAEPGASRLFQPTLSRIYTLATNRYFDYKAVEESGYFLSTDELGQAESFLGLLTDSDTFEVTKPANNCGYAAFLPYISSAETVIRSLIDEYELDTQVEFICSPLNDAGTNSPVYITPYFGLCANKNSENLIWIREFVNFLFQAENNRAYARDASIIPNTADALQYVAEKYGVDVETDVTLCGQIRFSDDYNGFTPLAAALKETLKCSAQKYMVNLNRGPDGAVQYETDGDGQPFLYLGNGETAVYPEYVGPEDGAMPGYAFCTLEYYLDALEEKFAEYRAE